MKTRILNTIGILALALSAGTAYAQTVPNTFNYQAVITAEDGTPVSNHQITVEVSIKQGIDCENSSCPVLWQELHSPKTNDFGSFSIEIGDANAINTTGGTKSKYSDIKWLDTKDGAYYLQVRVDFGEASYLNGMTDLGTTKFSAVPYSLAAQTADFAQSIATDDNGNIVNKIGQLADVTIKDVQPNQILVYDGTQNAWVNTNPAVTEGLKNVKLNGENNGHILVYKDGYWVNQPQEPKTYSLSNLTDVKSMNTVNGGDILYYNGTDNIWENQRLELKRIGDVQIKNSELTPGQVLKYDGYFWVAANDEGGSSVAKLSDLTGENISKTPAAGQILKYNGSKWEADDLPAAGADNTWLVGSDKSYIYTTFKKVGIGTGTDDDKQPKALLHIKNGNQNTLFSGKGITVGGNVDRIKNTGSIALGTGGDVEASGVIAGLGSSAGSAATNSIVMGDHSSASGKCDIVVGEYSDANNHFCALFGQKLKTNYNYQYVFGKNNVVSSDAMFVVANGEDGSPYNIFTINFDGTATLKGANVSSDSRLKTNINPLSNSLTNVMKLRGVTFNWNKATSPNASDKTQYGFIAQEVEKVFPDLVGTDSNGYKTVNYTGVIPVLTEAIKTQQEEIEALKSENEQLKSTLDQLLKRVEALENR